MGERAQSHRELEVYRRSFSAAMRILEASQAFPKEESYSLVDAIRRSSRSVSANLAEARRKRRYEGAFVAKLSDAEAEAAETQVWLEYALSCGYLDPDRGRELYSEYESILRTLVGRITHPMTWLLPHPGRA